jgi:hypothetical protein
MARRRKTKRGKPDEYFRVGPLEIARFGKVLVSKLNATAGEIDTMRSKMADDLPRIVAEIDQLVDRIAARVSRLPPENLLLRSWWEFAHSSIRPDKTPEDLNATMRMLEYTQSVIASVKPTEESADLTDEDWDGLKSDVRDLFTRVSFEYQMSSTADRRRQDQNLDMDLEDLRFRTEVFWINVRGERYHVHERQALLDILAPHSDVLIRLFGMDAPALVSELDKVLAKLTFGLHDSFLEMKSLQEAILARMAKLAEESPSKSIDELRNRVFEDPDLASKREKVRGEMFGVDLFDVELVTGLPKNLLDELVWSRGEDDEFFAPGEFSGWPLRVWPTMKRPFIRINGRILCFDMFALFDRFYRVLQRVIFQLEPAYKKTWNDRQKAVSEQLPLNYFQRLLPGAQVYGAVHYRWKTAGGATEWCETDGLVIYDDHLFISEVKAGAFTYTSPATDLQAHVASLRNLVLNPASQANRFIDYLESAAEVPIYDANHVEIGRLSRSSFRHVTPCAITLDPFTELAARSNHLRKVGIDIGQRPLWVLSIDDLRVYGDLIDNPLVFLHFVEQRMRAARSELVELDDELDHLGLYLSDNNYSLSAAKLAAGRPSKITFNGYRTPIDKYYETVLHGEPAVPPSQQMPEKLAEIVRFLSTSGINGSSEPASFLLDANGEYRAQLAAGIDEQLRGHHDLGRPLPLSTYGDLSLTLFAWSPLVRREAAFAVEHTQVVMAANDENSRPLLELEYAADGTLCGVHWQHIGLSDLSAAELERLSEAGSSLRGRRVAKVEAMRKIGRNEKCPCGSGKKYKQCHSLTTQR